MQRLPECPSDPWAEDINPLLDTDGSILYEMDYDGLLCAIIKRDDVATLTRYLARYPRAAIAPSMGALRPISHRCEEWQPQCPGATK
ncbi:hypothetical protein BDV32DRAFT_120139 [Aspergillus pseudonomiae]|nr:hypothetical protein BDV32DRAFT_120139 [Aspergillus pseudonomiae]